MGGPDVIFRRGLGTGFFGPRNGFFNGLEDGTFFRLGFKEGPAGARGNFLTTFVVGEGRFLALKVVFVVIVVLGFVVVVVVEVVEVVVETVVETVGLTNAAADGTGGGGG